MNKPRILVLAAAGKTGMPVALQLLGRDRRDQLATRRGLKTSRSVMPR